MANMMDYLKWRGDLSLADAPFGEVDSLLLAYVSYVNLDEIAPQSGEEARTLAEVSDAFFARYTQEELEKDKSFIRLAPYVMQEMAKTRRFGQAKLRNYVNLIDVQKHLQFSAVEILLGDGTSYIAFRGTDDRIVGWKEDFFLSNGVVPAETEAVAYLNRIGKKSARIIRLGGHSKGGNLAIYAAAECEDEVKEHIHRIYNLDGPGFTREFLNSQGLLKVQSKIRRYIPESSMIGTLLEHVAEPVIIASSNKGVMQHDGLSWEVLGPSFVKCGELSTVAEIFAQTMRGWLAELKADEKEEFINDFFSVLEAPGAETLTQLQDGGLKSVGMMLKQMDTLKPETRQRMRELLKSLAVHLPELLPFHKKEILDGKGDNVG